MLAVLEDKMSCSQKNWGITRYCWLIVLRPWVNYITSLNISYHLLKMRIMSAFAYLLIWSCPAYFYEIFYIYHQIKYRLNYRWVILKKKTGLP